MHDDFVIIIIIIIMKGLINVDKLGYLREILDAINRQDLCEMIKSFEEGGYYCL